MLQLIEFSALETIKTFFAPFQRMGVRAEGERGGAEELYDWLLVAFFSLFYFAALYGQDKAPIHPAQNLRSPVNSELYAVIYPAPLAESQVPS